MRRKPPCVANGPLQLRRQIYFTYNILTGRKGLFAIKSVGCQALPIVLQLRCQTFFTNCTLSRRQHFRFRHMKPPNIATCPFLVGRWIYFTSRTLSGSNWRARFRRRNPPQLAGRRLEIPLSDLFHQLRFDW